MKTPRKHVRREERVVEIQAKVDQLIRLDRAEDQLLAQAAREAREAELHAENALTSIAAAKRVDALEDEVIADLRTETREIAGDVTALAAEVIGIARDRISQPRLLEASK